MLSTILIKFILNNKSILVKLLNIVIMKKMKLILTMTTIVLVTLTTKVVVKRKVVQIVLL